MIVSIDCYGDFLAVCQKFGTPQSVFYKLTSGDVVHAAALFLGGGVAGSTVNGAQPEVSFLAEFPNAVELSAAFSLKGY